MEIADGAFQIVLEISSIWRFAGALLVFQSPFFFGVVNAFKIPDALVPLNNPIGLGVIGRQEDQRRDGQEK